MNPTILASQARTPLAASPPNSAPSVPTILFIAVAAIIVAALIVLWRFAQQRQRLREAEQHIRDLKPRVPDNFYGREFLYVCFTRLFDVPDNFLDVNEPSFAPIRLGWLLGMVELLGSSAEMCCGYLDPAAHPEKQVLTMEFWVNFDYDGQRWTIWYPGRDYAVTRRSSFSNYVGTIHRRHAHDEIDAWLRRSGYASKLP